MNFAHRVEVLPHKLRLLPVPSDFINEDILTPIRTNGVLPHSLIRELVRSWVTAERMSCINERSFPNFLIERDFVPFLERGFAPLLKLPVILHLFSKILSRQPKSALVPFIHCCYKGSLVCFGVLNILWHNMSLWCNKELVFWKVMVVVGSVRHKRLARHNKGVWREERWRVFWFLEDRINKGVWRDFFYPIRASEGFGGCGVCGGCGDKVIFLWLPSPAVDKIEGVFQSYEINRRLKLLVQPLGSCSDPLRVCRGGFSLELSWKLYILATHLLVKIRLRILRETALGASVSDLKLHKISALAA